MQRSFTVVILDSGTTTFQMPEMYEIASHKLFILRIKNVTLQKIYQFLSLCSEILQCETIQFIAFAP